MYFKELNLGFEPERHLDNGKVDRKLGDDSNTLEHDESSLSICSSDIRKLADNIWRFGCWGKE